jgi:hypothetical protein
MLVSKCQRCQSERILSASGKCSDCFSAFYQDESVDGYVPYDINVGGGDYIEFKLCMDCGQVQGQFPVAQEVITEALSHSR